MEISHESADTKPHLDLLPGVWSVLAVWIFFFLQPFKFEECKTKHQLWQEAQSFLGGTAFTHSPGAQSELRSAGRKYGCQRSRVC